MKLNEAEIKALDELTRKAAFLAAETADFRKAEEIALYDVSNCSILADYYMICTGFSEPHLKAIATNIEKDLKESLDILPKKVIGSPESQWIVLDYPNIIIHIFHPDSRKRYRIEELWKEGTKILPVEDIQESDENTAPDHEASI